MIEWTKLISTQAAAAYDAARNLMGKVEPSQLGWKPASGHNWMTTSQLLRHLATACGLTAQGFVTGNWQSGDHGVDPKWKPTPDHQMPPAEAYLGSTVAEAQALLDRDREVFTKMLAQAGETRLTQEMSKAPWGVKPVCLGEHFITCIQHLDSHRHQLFYYLKLQGQPVHTGTLWSGM